jgi:hypothetical protein
MSFTEFVSDPFQNQILIYANPEEPIIHDNCTQAERP